MPKIYFETLNEDVCKYAKKPSPASAGLANWWKNMDKFDYSLIENSGVNFPHSDFATARSCPALNDAFNFGYILYNPVDVYLDATQDDDISWIIPNTKLSIGNSDTQSYIGFHNQKQVKGLQKDLSFNKNIVKLNTFFGIKTDKGYSTWITHPIGRTDLPFRVVDGIVDTDVFPSRFPYAFFIKKDFKGLIKAGTPLIQAIPFKREDFVSKIIDADFEDISSNEQILKLRFVNAYKKIFWKRKKFI